MIKSENKNMSKEENVVKYESLNDIFKFVNHNNRWRFDTFNIHYIYYWCLNIKVNYTTLPFFSYTTIKKIIQHYF